MVGIYWEITCYFIFDSCYATDKEVIIAALVSLFSHIISVACVIYDPSSRRPTRWVLDFYIFFFQIQNNLMIFRETNQFCKAVNSNRLMTI